MKTKELIEILQTLRPDDEIVIRLAGVGQRWEPPQTPIVNVLQGFDWQHGTTFLFTQDNIQLVNNHHPVIKNP